jgi:outer membrane receptor protein involved in Fe transport
MDATVTYKFAHAADTGYDAEAFLNITNIANKDPAVVATGPSGFPYAAPPINPTFYDVLGRVFHAGIRFKL